ncbi:unnamed protein product, partial [Prunus brigantina]
NRGKNYVWLDPSVRVRRQPTVIRRSHELTSYDFQTHHRVPPSCLETVGYFTPRVRGRLNRAVPGCS